MTRHGLTLGAIGLLAAGALATGATVAPGDGGTATTGGAAGGIVGSRGGPAAAAAVRAAAHRDAVANRRADGGVVLRAGIVPLHGRAIQPAGYGRPTTAP